MTRAAAAAATAAGGSCTVQSLSWTVEVPVGRCFLVSALFCRLFRPRTKSRTALKSRPASCTTHHHITIMSQSLGVDSTHHGPRPINLYNSSKYKLPKLAWRDLNTRIQLLAYNLRTLSQFGLAPANWVKTTGSARGQMFGDRN
ncbi:hypothetical protein AXG93_4548s1230 [Marchantia polymorpha subsp. ruderalis]|uniref:Uncharacterized protein n=1 Tax=Marchantia polymorpha subsp. ruderalis TaxID=1480154 RepID=A0A176WB46_MARPO|nr:hypothetical protein AXG93_4548s1230 [Marchantia polymorpha subsp. ruderalis]